MPKLIVCAAFVLCAGTAAFAATPKDVTITEPAAKQEAAQPQPLRVAPFTRTNRYEDLIKPEQPPVRVAPYTKSNLKDCVPVTAPARMQATPRQCS